MSNKKNKKSKEKKKSETGRCPKCETVNDTEKEKCMVCHEDIEAEQQENKAEQQSVEAKQPPTEAEQPSTETEQQPNKTEQQASNAEQSSEAEQQPSEAEQQPSEAGQQPSEAEQQPSEAEQKASEEGQQTDEKKQPSEKKEQPEKDSDGEESESSILKIAFVLGTVALIIFIIVMTIINVRGPGDELYVEEEVVETDEPSEELIDGEIEIPEGVLSNDYVVILQYKGLELFIMEMPEITEDSVEFMIQSKLAAQSTTHEVTDRPAEEGDIVTIDFAGSVDGEYFDGGTSEGFDLTLGAGMFLGPYGDYEGFEEQIIGHEIGDNFDITVQFPADYFSPDLAGEVANFNITIHAITETITPELTDEWVQENSDEATTVEEYRQMLMDELYEVTKASILQMQQNAVFDALMEQVVVIEIPEWAIEEEAMKLKTLFQNIAASEGMTLEEYLLLAAQMDEETFNQEVLRVAEEITPRMLALYLIIEYENIELTQEEKERRIEALALMNEVESAERYIEILGEGFVHEEALLLRVTEFLIEHAVAVN